MSVISALIKQPGYPNHHLVIQSKRGTNSLSKEMEEIFKLTTFILEKRLQFLPLVPNL